MSGYTDGQGRFRKVAGGSTIKADFPECEVCGYLGAPHEPETCERNKAWGAKRRQPEPPVGDRCAVCGGLWSAGGHGSC